MTRVEDCNMADMAAQFTWNITTSKRTSKKFLLHCSIWRQLGSVFKILHVHAWQSEIILEFPQKNSSSPSKTVDLCLEMSSDFSCISFALWLRKISSLGILQIKTQCLGVRIEAQAHGKAWINKRPTSDHRCSDQLAMNTI